MLVLHEFVLDTNSTQNTDRAHTYFWIIVGKSKTHFSVSDSYTKLVNVVINVFVNIFVNVLINIVVNINAIIY